MDNYTLNKTYFELLQMHFTDALHHVWQQPNDFCGSILLTIQDGGIRCSKPGMKGNHLAVKAYAKPLSYGLTGFDEKFSGTVRIVVDSGILKEVNFMQENGSTDDDLQAIFLTWYSKWETEEKKRLKSQGMSNRLCSEMRKSLSIEEILDRRIGSLDRRKSVEKSLIAWALREITGDNGYTGKVTVYYRNGGIRHTEPRMALSVNRKRLAKALMPILPIGEGKIIYNLNKGLLNT
jgi:hypothetical protein